jgi:hypothetical protein
MLTLYAKDLAALPSEILSNFFDFSTRPYSTFLLTAIWKPCLKPLVRMMDGASMHVSQLATARMQSTYQTFSLDPLAFPL